MKLKEIAEAIAAHLARFETDPKANPVDRNYGTHPFYRAGSWASGRYVCVVYVTYQGHSNLTKEQAIQYLDWLNAGNVGRHYEALRAEVKP